MAADQREFTHIDARGDSGRAVRALEYMPDSLSMRVEDEHGYVALRSLHELMPLPKSEPESEPESEPKSEPEVLDEVPRVGSVVRAYLGGEQGEARVVSKAHGMLYLRLVNGHIHSRPPRDVVVVDLTLPRFSLVADPTKWVGKAVRIRQRCGDCLAYNPATDTISIQWYSDEASEDRCCADEHVDHVGSKIFLRRRGAGWKKHR